jgi:hypothetical protein
MHLLSTTINVLGSLVGVESWKPSSTLSVFKKCGVFSGKAVLQ